MATTARGTTRVGARTISRNPIVEEIIPNSGWTEDPTGHYLLLDLPDFRKEEVNLQVDNSSGSIIVRGERKLNDWKSVHFQLTFPVPQDSDADKIAGNFDSGILYVTVPKRIAKENKESEIQEIPNNVERAEENENQELNGNNKGRDPSDHDNQREKEVQRNVNAQIREYSEELIRKWEQEPMLRNAVEVVRKNKGIVITAVIAFSLGILVSRKFHFSSPP